MDGQTFGVTMEREERFRFTVSFDQDGVAPLTVDEPHPVGDGSGPNPTRLLAAAVGNCLTASLLFCLQRARIEPSDMRTVVEGELVRNADGRLRISRLQVRIHPTMAEGTVEKMGRCLGVFEDFCMVTASVRDGLDVDVEVIPEVAEELVGSDG